MPLTVNGYYQPRQRLFQWITVINNSGWMDITGTEEWTNVNFFTAHSYIEKAAAERNSVGNTEYNKL